MKSTAGIGNLDRSLVWQWIIMVDASRRHFQDSSLLHCDSMICWGFGFLSSSICLFSCLLFKALDTSWKKTNWWKSVQEKIKTVNPKDNKKIAKDNKVMPDPIDDRKLQEWKESGKSGILLGITLNPRKCIGEKVRRIPINVETKW